MAITTSTNITTTTTTTIELTMKLKLLLLTFSALLLTNLTACTVKGPSIKVGAPIKIEGGGNCPPGQAKKGRC